MNHVQFPPTQYHYHYSCLCLLDLCGDNFITTTFPSFHTDLCTLVCSLAIKNLIFFQFECIIVYFLYCLACLHKKQNVAYATSIFSSFSISIKSHICSVVCIALSISIQNKKSHIQKKMSMKSLFYKVVGLQVCNFIKKRLQHRCFPVKFAKVLRTPILENICERLLLHILLFFFDAKD